MSIETTLCWISRDRQRHKPGGTYPSIKVAMEAQAAFLATLIDECRGDLEKIADIENGSFEIYGTKIQRSGDNDAL